MIRAARGRDNAIAIDASCVADIAPDDGWWRCGKTLPDLIKFHEMNHVSFMSIANDNICNP